MKARISSVAILILAFLSAPTLQADVIIQPVSATTDMGSIGFGDSTDNTINQVGLSVAYVSGVTNVDAYVGLNPTHNNSGNGWTSDNFNTIGNFDFDLGGTYSINRMLFWNKTSTTAALTGITLLADDNASFSSPTTLGTYTPVVSDNFFAGPLEVFEFNSISASHVRMSITSNDGSQFNSGFGEAAFSAVPEPSLTIALIPLLGFCMYRRNR